MRKKLLHIGAGIVLSLFSNAAQSQNIFALSNESLVRIDAQSLGSAQEVIAITGLPMGMTWEGLDFRPATGELFALAYSQMSGEARLFTIDKMSGMAMAVGMSNVMLAPSMGQITFDFNPTVDRIRVMGSNGSNYRLNPITGGIAATDGNLAFAAADVNAMQTPNIISGAYINSYIGATATSLFNLDGSLEILSLQNPPNNGVQNTVGALGVMLADMPANGDLDIHFDVMSGMNTAYLIATPDGEMVDHIYTINTMNGMASDWGVLASDMDFSDLAIEIIQAPTPAMGRIVYGLTSNNYLITFDSQNPSNVYSHLATSGITSGQVLVGMDVRPATGELYGLGYNSATGEARLYVINTATGALTAIGDMATMLAPMMGKVSVDFNPVVDRVRVLGSNNQNYRLHPVTGVIAATDLDLHYAIGDVNEMMNPSIGTGAYTNSYAGAASTTLYNYDDSLNVFTTQVPPNDGNLMTLGSSGLMVNLANPSTDLDIYFVQPGNMNVAIFTANTGTADIDRLYSIDLANGMAMDWGKIGNGIAVVDIAAQVMTVDMTAPQLMCMGDQNLELGSECMVEIPDYAAMVTVSDDMDMEVSVMQSPAPGTWVGENTMVSIMATDDAGNMASCMFNVMVMDVIAPMIDCPADIMVNNPDNMDMMMVTVPQPSVMENCSGFVWTNSFNDMMDASGMYPEGNTEVVFTVTDAAGNMAMCSVNVMVEEVNVGVEELNSSLSLSVYPNPTSNEVNISVAALQNEAVSLEIVDMTGRVIQQERMMAIAGSTTTQKVEVSTLSSGLYLVRVKGQSGTLSTEVLEIQ